MARYRIFPPIGIARVGDDDNFFLGPEVPGSGPGEFQPDGSLNPVTKFKDATRTKVRKQGARFHIFESDDGIEWRPANLPATAKVTWSVTLENKKSAVTRPSSPPIAPTRPQVPAANQARIIKGGTREISGANQASTPFKGTYATTSASGQAFSVEVELGQLRTDGQGRLIVLGGKGFSSAPPGTQLGPSFYRNPRWHDDVADGPVTASIRLTPSSAPVQAEGGAWVIVGPPDYAPNIDCVVTLFDVIRQVGIDKNELPQPGIPSFNSDISPMLTRVRRLQWVHADARWSNPKLSDPKLRSKAAGDKQLRQDVRAIVLKAEEVFTGHIDPSGPRFRLRAFQKKILDEWVNGNFDATAITPPADFTSSGLTRAALDGGAGQGFCPGIEAGIIVLDQALYVAPFDFRFDHNSVSAGDLTALMAQPWQADFMDCNTEWWPTQRPDLAPQSDGTNLDWPRKANTKRLMLERSSRLGFIVQQGTNEVFLEAERDPNLN